jgi:hypothetical protein
MAKLYSESVNRFNMELSEKERQMLVEKKAEIRKLTDDIVELSEDLKKNRIEIKKRISGILSSISVIASFTSSKKIDMIAFAQFSEILFWHLDKYSLKYPYPITTDLDIFCNIANSIRFDFTTRGLKVKINKIDLSIFRTGK